MMKKARLLPSFLLFAIPMTGQVEHALTPEQCRADADAWSIPKWAYFTPETEFQNLAGVMMRTRSVTAKTMEARRTELVTCVKTDNLQANRYAQANRAYAIAEMGRMAEFMRRHNLMEKFYQEDEQRQK